MKLHTEYGGYKISLIEQGDASCLLWEHGNEAEIVPLPEDVVYALMNINREVIE